MDWGQFASGFVLGAFAGGIIVALMMGVLMSGKFLDMQDKIDELETEAAKWRALI